MNFPEKLWLGIGKVVGTNHNQVFVFLCYRDPIYSKLIHLWNDITHFPLQGCTD